MFDKFASDFDKNISEHSHDPGNLLLLIISQNICNCESILSWLGKLSKLGKTWKKQTGQGKSGNLFIVPESMDFLFQF